MSCKEEHYINQLNAMQKMLDDYDALRKKAVINAYDNRIHYKYTSDLFRKMDSLYLEMQQMTEKMRHDI